MSDGRTVSIVVTLRLPDGASRSAAADYVRNEVKAGCGGLHPQDPMSRLDRSSVRVRPLARSGRSI